MKKGEQQIPQPLLVCFVALTQDVGIFSSRDLDETLLDSLQLLFFVHIYFSFFPLHLL
jgi:hypothetical protein